MGLALLWKSRGPGSQELLGTFKRDVGLAGKGREGIGHTGTLDPFAEGGLVVGTGEGTKLLAPLTGLDKTYEASMVFEATSDTFDDEGQLSWAETPLDTTRLTDESLRAFLAQQIGEFDQIPPAYSAVHIDGKRAHEWARAGVEKELKSRRCRLVSAEHLGLGGVTLLQGKPVTVWHFRVRVTAGTYIRALARDWGQSLVGRPGLLCRLVRSGVGPFSFGRPVGPQSGAGLNSDVGVAQPGVHWLTLEDLKPLFDLRALSGAEADALKRFGRWTPVGGSLRPALLVGSEGVPVAWTHAETGAIGRVFLSNPLAIP